MGTPLTNKVDIFPNSIERDSLVSGIECREAGGARSDKAAGGKQFLPAEPFFARW